MKRCYLSGPMRGFPDNNNAEFARVGQELAAHGYSVMNPAYTRHPDGSKRHEYLREDALMLLVSEAVFVLPNWHLSPGARWEVATAWAFNIPVEVVHVTPTVTVFIPLDAYSVVIPRENQYADGRPLVGLCGYARAGKDTFANVMVDQHSYQRVAFADPLKKIATDCGWDGQKDDTGRVFLQSLGVAVRDHLDADAWVRVAEEEIDSSNSPVVLTDVRFPNELAMVRRRKGTLIWIERPGISAVNAHVSEHSVGPNDCDLKYTNDVPLEQVSQSVTGFLWTHDLIGGN